MPDSDTTLSCCRVLVVPNEFPLPVNTGGRVDVWRRLRLMNELGATTALLTWYDAPRDGSPLPELLDMAAATCSAIHLTPITRRPTELIRRLMLLGRLPSHAASRWVTIDRRSCLDWARAFRPTVLMADGLYGVAVVRWLAEALGVPWVYRSHNIEHAYMRVQVAQSTRAVRRLGLLANVWGLKSLEFRTVRDASSVLDISTSDIEYWRARVRPDVQWLPTLVDDGFVRDLQAAESRPKEWDALYFGNLNTPNNVRAVHWLAEEVLPLVEEPGLRIAIAGSKPSAEVLRAVEAEPRLHLIPNPTDMAGLVGCARVLLNPVQGGSGVNLKSVEMLHSRAWLLSTPSGVQGLPQEAAACFEVASDAPRFAHALAILLRRPAPDGDVLRRREVACAPFSASRAGRLLLGALHTAPVPTLEAGSAGAAT